MPAIQFEAIDHVSLPVAVGEAGDEAGPLERSKAFFGGVLGLREVGRPSELAKSIRLGAWYRVGGGGSTLHLIADEDGQATFRRGKRLASRDVHFALRVSDFVATLRHLVSHGYWLQHHRPDGGEELDLKEMRVSPEGRAGFPQIFVMDPDRNVIELNVAALLTDEELALVEAELGRLKGPPTG